MNTSHLAILTLAAALAGCSGGSEASRRTALDCPAVQGRLTRSAVAPDARTCTYTSQSGDEVSLRLIPVATTPQAALSPIEGELQAQVPQAPAKTDKPAADPAKDADAAEANADEHDSANITLPGVHIQADSGKADVRVGSLSVQASDGGAVVREGHHVRLRGEALSRERRGYRAVFVIARGDLPGGLTSVGYEAGGPSKGPLTVAVMRTRGHDVEDIHRDAQRLVRRNGGY